MLERSLAVIKTIKVWAGVIGAGATAASAIAGLPLWVTILGMVATGVAVFEVPYQPMESHNG
jgi:hypothetical protein